MTAPQAALAAATGAALLAGTPALAAKGLAPGERVDLNRATVSELMRVPGVGEAKAQAIVALRHRRPFRRVEDVLAVRGLGPRWLARVKASVTVTAPAGPAPGAGPAPAAGPPARR